MVGGDVGGGEEAPPVAELPGPPVLVALVGDGDDVAAPELELAVLLRHEVVQRLHQELLGRHHLQLDVLAAGHAGRAVVLHQLVQAVELDHPEEELALGVPQHLEVLHPVPALHAQREVARTALAHAHHERALVFVHEELLGAGAGDAAVVPRVGLHLDVVGGYQALPPVQLGPEPVHVILLVEHLQYLVFPEAEFVICRGVEIVFCYSLHCIQVYMLCWSTSNYITTVTSHRSEVSDLLSLVGHCLHGHSLITTHC